MFLPFDNITIWDEPLDDNVDYSLCHQKDNLMINAFIFQHDKLVVSSSPNTYPPLRIL